MRERWWGWEYIINHELVKAAANEEMLKAWVTEYPTMNGYTDFACILDPKMGEIRFLERRYEN